MIRKVEISNYKSIPKLTLDLGRVTVLIGANGSGKSNIVEALALASAAAQSKLDNEFLISRGIRVTDTHLMRSAFRELPPPKRAIEIAFREGDEPNIQNVASSRESIEISVEAEGEVAFRCDLVPDETVSYPKWQRKVPLRLRDFMLALEAEDPKRQVTRDALKRIVEEIEKRLIQPVGTLVDFLVYCPENSALRTFQSEGQILPLGTKGEGLFAHLKALKTKKNKPRIAKIRERLKLIDWFESFNVPDDLSPGERSIRIQDRYLPESTQFDQRSANEGFLYLLFYFTLLMSPDTPKFFSIENIETCLNPKICSALITQIAELTKDYGRQVILTTHNPAILDGLDLNDDEQRLLVVERNSEGHTCVRRVYPAKPSAGELPVSLSEAFMRGYIGGLPKNF